MKECNSCIHYEDASRYDPNDDSELYTLMKCNLHGHVTDWPCACDDWEGVDESMESIEKLRELLDEQGLEWRQWTKSGKRGFTNVETTWFVPYSRIGCNEPGGFFSKASESAHGLLHLKSIVASPEQAIAATLGSEKRTCEVVASEPDGQMWVYRHEFSCECGQRNLFTSSSIPPNYCPNCGAKVVE